MQINAKEKWLFSIRSHYKKALRTIQKAKPGDGKRDIHTLERKQSSPNMLGMVPKTDNTDKVLNYERGLQKFLYQNFIMLKKLQRLF